jgi:hypothetical protein
MGGIADVDDNKREIKLMGRRSMNKESEAGRPGQSLHISAFQN